MVHWTPIDSEFNRGRDEEQLRLSEWGAAFADAATADATTVYAATSDATTVYAATADAFAGATADATAAASTKHLCVACRKAKLLLKKKRYLESRLEQTSAQLDNLEHMVHSIEFSRLEVQVAGALKQGTETLNQIHRLMSLDDVERIVEDSKDAVAYQQVHFLLQIFSE